METKRFELLPFFTPFVLTVKSMAVKSMALLLSKTGFTVEREITRFGG